MKEALITLIMPILAFFGMAEQPQDNVGAFSDPFLSIQVGTSPTNGYVLQTDGTDSLWVATSTLGIAGGSGSGLATTSINTEAKLESILTDVTDVFTDNDTAFINEADLDATNAPTDNYVLTYNQAGGNFTWAADQTGAGGSSGTVSTTTPLVDTYVTYATGAATIGSESAFTYDDATNQLQVDYLNATNSTTSIQHIGNYISFATTSTHVPVRGELTWDLDYDALRLGQDGADASKLLGLPYVKAAENITKGDVLYASGAVGASGKIEASRFIANGTIDERYVIGVAAESITTGNFGHIAVFYDYITGITTDGSDVGETWTSGTVLFASSTAAGKMTNVEPVAPNQSIPLAFVINAHASNGTLVVRIPDTYHIGELNDVYSTSTANRDALLWSSANSRWENRPIVEADVSDLIHYTDSDVQAQLLVGNNAIFNNSTTTNATSTNLFATNLKWTNLLSTVDISDNTNLTVGATGIELSNDDIALTTGYNIPLTASTTEWDTAYSWGNHALGGYLTSVAPTDMNASDFGDFTCNGTTCSLDATYATSLDTAYNGGSSITADSGAVTITSPNTSNNAALVLNQNDTTNSPSVLEINGPSTGTGGLPSAGADILLTNTNAGVEGPYFVMYQNSATPEVDDAVGSIYFYGKDSGGNDTFYGGLSAKINDPTDTIETGAFTIFGKTTGANVNLLVGGGINGISVGSLTATGIVESFGNQDLQLQTGNTTTGTITITDGANGDITLAPNGTGIVDISSLGNVGTIDATTETTIEAAIDTLSNLTSVGTITTGTWQATLASTSIGSAINAATAKTTPADADMFGLMDSAAANVLKKFSWANLKTAMQTFLEGANLAITGAWDFGGATSLEIPNGTNPTVNATGEVAVDTTDNQLLAADSGGTARVYGRAETTLFSFALASTSADFVNGGIIDIAKNTKDGRDITQYRCHVDGGTSVVVNVSDGTNDTETITCGTTQTSDTDVATNSTFTADELWEVQIGAITGTPDYLIFEAYGYITRE